MRATTLLSVLILGFGISLTPRLGLLALAHAEARPEGCWNIEDVRPGMKGEGRTVMKGTKVETFQAEVLGVLKNTSPGRDMILCRLSGLDLEKTGVIAGMSGSPIYIGGRLLGAVAFAWPYGKEPIAGVTPFGQMYSYVEAYVHGETGQRQKTRVGLAQPLMIGGRQFDTVTVAGSFDVPQPVAADGLCMVPLQTPLSATNFTSHSLGLLRDRLRGTGLVPMQGGGANARITEETRNTPLEPGGPLAVALITGDFDLSGIGTVTHITSDQRVYGWGHPYFGVGACEFPLMTGYIHTIYPRQTLSFKMGSPVRTVGVINADVSTGIAGWLGRKPDMLPMRVTVTRTPPEGQSRTFNVTLARQRGLMPTLVYSVLVNAVDMEGELPDELTADLHVRVEVEGREPVLMSDVFSGSSYSGGRAPQALFSQVSSMVHLLTFNTYKNVRINRIECDIVVHSGRRTAEIEAVELDSEVYAPGDTIKATAFVHPYKGLVQRLPVTLKLPPDLPEGSYTATICDDIYNARMDMRDNPNLSNPQNLDHLFASLKILTAAKRSNLVLRLPTSAVGVAMAGKALPNLPPSMVHIFGRSRRTGAQTMGGALVARQSTSWVIQGAESVQFTVVKHKKILEDN